MNLRKVLFFLGDTQLKVICFLSAVGLFITVGITCYSVSERVLIKRGYLSFLLVGLLLVCVVGSADGRVQAGKPSSLLFVLIAIWHTIMHLPIRIRAIFGIQFFAWLGWFNMLFYSSTWYSSPRERLMMKGLVRCMLDIKTVFRRQRMKQAM